MHQPTQPAPSLLQSLADHTCPYCRQPLGRSHAYPVTDPSTLISLLTPYAPHHRDCAEEMAALHILGSFSSLEMSESPAPLPVHLIVVLTVKATPTGPSGRLVRLSPEDPDSLRLHLFQPETITFRPYGEDRPATNEEAEAWMSESIAVAASHAPPGSDEYQEIARQLARLQPHLPRRVAAAAAPAAAHCTVPLCRPAADTSRPSGCAASPRAP